jgi:hypothetical protein
MGAAVPKTSQDLDGGITGFSKQPSPGEELGGGAQGEEGRKGWGSVGEGWDQGVAWGRGGARGSLTGWGSRELGVLSEGK